MRLRIGMLCSALGLIAIGCSSSDSPGSNPGAGGSNSNGGSSPANGGASGNTTSNGGSGTNHGGSSTTGGTSSGNGGSSAGGLSSGGAVSGDVPQIGGCPMFTANDAWNVPVTGATVDAAWTKKLQNLVGAVNVHPDYGVDGMTLYGIPFNIVPGDQAPVAISFDESGESDPGPYPIPDPSMAKVEGGTPESCDGDCHLLVIQQGSCKLYEGDACGYSGGWHCYSGAVFDLRKNSYGQRKKGYTSADAAGLSIAAGLVRYDEATAGAIHHAIRFTVPCTLDKYVKPASHFAVPTKPPGCASNANAVPMGLHVRLKQGVTVKNPSKAALAVITAMQTYGMILADNGSSFYFQGESSAKWADADIEPLKEIPASAFEVVNVPPLEP